MLQGPAGDRHRRVSSIETGCERIDSRLPFHNKDFRYGHAGGNGHLLDDVDQSAAQWIIGIRRDLGGTQLARHDAATVGQTSHSIQACKSDEAKGDQGHGQ